MQTTIYYREEDQFLLEKLEEMAKRQRKSKSACLLSILEKYFEAEKRLGEILVDLGVLSEDGLQEALEEQKDQANGKRIGELLLERDYVDKEDIQRALDIQKMVS